MNEQQLLDYYANLKKEKEIKQKIDNYKSFKDKEKKQRDYYAETEYTSPQEEETKEPQFRTYEYHKRLYWVHILIYLWIRKIIKNK